jgi:hypothetical protein
MDGLAVAAAGSRHIVDALDPAASSGAKMMSSQTVASISAHSGTCRSRPLTPAANPKCPAIIDHDQAGRVGEAPPWRRGHQQSPDRCRQKWRPQAEGEVAC